MFGAPPAQAQPAVPPSPQTQAAAPNAPSTVNPSTQVGEVIVTAERRSQTVQNVPASITALSGAALAVRGVGDIDDLSRLVPSVNFGSIGYGPQISARGVGMDLVAGEGESSVAVQLDGIPLSRPSEADLAQDDLQRVEFLLGPQGTLYGRNATAGVLNLLTNDPQRTLTGGISAGAGNYDAWNVNGYVTGPIGDHVRARLYAGQSDQQGYLYDTTTGAHLDGSNNTTIHLGVDADLTPSVAMEIRAFELRSQSEGPAYKPLQAVPGLSSSDYQLSPWRIAADGDYSSRRELEAVSVKLVDSLGAMGTLSSQTAYLHYRDDQTLDGDGTALALFQNSRPEVTNQLTEEILYLRDSSLLKLTAGMFYMYEHINDLGEVVDTPDIYRLWA